MVRDAASGWLDAIVTDPPYGIRAKSKKVGVKKEEDKKEVTDRENYITQTNEYAGDQILVDLIKFAEDNLVDHGKLVFLLPIDLMALKYGDSKDAHVLEGGQEQAYIRTSDLRELVLPEKRVQINKGEEQEV